MLCVHPRFRRSGQSFTPPAELPWHIEETASQVSLDHPGSATDAFRAAQSGDLEMVKAILDTGMDVNQKRPQSRFATALYLAATDNLTEMCQLLIERGAICHSDGSQQMLRATITDQNLVLLSLLLAQLRLRDSRYLVSAYTLQPAVLLGDCAIFKALLQSGAILAKRDGLETAIRKKDQPILEEMIGHKGYEEFLDEDVVQLAFDFGLVNIVELILSTRRPRITSNKLIIEALRDNKPWIAKTILRYPSLRLLDPDLQECRNLSREMGFEAVTTVIEKMNETQSKLQILCHLVPVRPWVLLIEGSTNAARVDEAAARQE